MTVKSESVSSVLVTFVVTWSQETIFSSVTGTSVAEDELSKTSASTANILVDKFNGTEEFVSDDVVIALTFLSPCLQDEAELFFARNFVFARPDLDERLPDSLFSPLSAPSLLGVDNGRDRDFFGSGGDRVIWPTMWFLNGGYGTRSYGYEENGLNDELLDAEVEPADGNEFISGVVMLRYEEGVCEDRWAEGGSASPLSGVLDIEKQSNGFDAFDVESGPKVAFCELQVSVDCDDMLSDSDDKNWPFVFEGDCDDV